MNKYKIRTKNRNITIVYNFLIKILIQKISSENKLVNEYKNNNIEGCKINLYFIFCESMKLWPHLLPRSLFSDPKDIRNLSLGAIWKIIKGIGLP